MVCHYHVRAVAYLELNFVGGEVIIDQKIHVINKLIIPKYFMVCGYVHALPLTTVSSSGAKILKLREPAVSKLRGLDILII